VEVDLEEAASLLERGEVVAVPTDTVFGLAVDPARPEPVFTLKNRPEERRLIHLIADRAQIDNPVPDGFEERAAEGWPGALTLVIPYGQSSLGFRIPDCPPTLALLRRCGPLAVTSANRSGDPPALSRAEVEAVFGSDFPVLAGEIEPSGTPSQIWKWEGEWRRIR